MMQFSSCRYADVVVATPSGRVDHASAASFEQLLLPLVADAGERKAGVVLDFGGVAYISSVGLRVLMVAAKQMRGTGAPIVVAAPQPVVAEIFAISRFDHVLEIVPSVRDALARLSLPALAAYDGG